MRRRLIPHASRSGLLDRRLRRSGEEIWPSSLFASPRPAFLPLDPFYSRLEQALGFLLRFLALRSPLGLLAPGYRSLVSH